LTVVCVVGAGGGVERGVLDALDRLQRVGDGGAAAGDRGERAGGGGGGQHRLQAGGGAAGADRERQMPGGPREGGEAGAVAAEGPVERLLGGDERYAEGLGHGDGGVLFRAVGVVGVEVGDEEAVVAVRAERVVEERGRRRRVALTGLVGHVGV